MVNKIMRGFDVYVDLASKFVEKQRGIWDHEKWLDFLLDAQKKGFDFNDEIKANLGLLLESMKKFYNVATATKEIDHLMLQISELTVNYFKKASGVWDQSEWESFLKTLQNKGFYLNEESISYLREVLTSAKKFYTILTPSAREEKVEKS